LVDAGTTSRIAECYDRVRYPTEDQEACECPQHTTQLAGVWSHCRLDADLTQFDHDLYERSIGQFRPGRGYCGTWPSSTMTSTRGQSVNLGRVAATVWPDPVRPWPSPEVNRSI